MKIFGKILVLFLNILNIFIQYIFKKILIIKVLIFYKGTLLTWREIKIQNKKLTSISLIKFMVDSLIIPKLVGLDIIMDFMRKIMPPNN